METSAVVSSLTPAPSSYKWAADIHETHGCALNFPLISDTDRSVATLYGMIHPNAGDTMTVRSVFVIGPDKKIKLTITYPPSCGRNFDEILRAIDSAAHGQAQGRHPRQLEARRGLHRRPPSLSDEEATKLFLKGFKKIKPYLRVTPQPNL